MGERGSYEPGTFCAVDLASPDREASQAFYAGLFGWEVAEMPPGHDFFTTFLLDGRTVAGAIDHRGDGSPAWLSYVSVQSADAACARAVELGATVIQETSTVEEAGRVCVLADPAGAVFAVWEAGGFAGAGLVNDVGALTLNQLNTIDVEGAMSFYGDLFGWRTDFVGSDDLEYWGIYNGESMNGGLMRLPEGGPAPPHWLVYFASADLEASLARAEELGGAVVVGPTPAGEGRIAVAGDPGGAVFGLFEGPLDP